MIEMQERFRRYYVHMDVHPTLHTPCWEWYGSTTGYGYGGVCIDGRVIRVHRLYYELFVGPIPEGLQIDHLCSNRLCMNPEHLEAVTGSVNVLRGKLVEVTRARTAAITHCRQGHAFDAENTVWYGGRRFCRACRKKRAAVTRARKKERLRAREPLPDL